VVAGAGSPRGAASLQANSTLSFPRFAATSASEDDAGNKYL
jgi:hypothetical protein